jgi:shikimate kinase
MALPPTAERIFLIGPRGSGKTTVAEILARELGWQWLDADAELEHWAGMTIRQIFDREGEAGFRRRESELLRELAQLDRHVIATGGGVVVEKTNRDMFSSNSGYTVWLDADADTLWRRIQADTTTAERRPRLTVGGREEVEQLLEQRRPLYGFSADFRVLADLEPRGVAGEISLQYFRDGGKNLMQSQE